MSARFARRSARARRHNHLLNTVPTSRAQENVATSNWVAETLPQAAGHPASNECWINRLGAREFRRRLWHLTPGLLPILFWLLPHRDPVRWPQLLVISSVAIVGAIVGCRAWRNFSRAGEQNCLSCALGYASMSLLSLLLFPGQVELAMVVLATLAFGDGAATLGGLLLRGPKLPWNPQKTWAGSACFVLAALPISTLYYWAEAQPHVSWNEALASAAVAVSAGAIAESIPTRINDNFRVPLAALLGVVLLHQYVLGWQ